MSATNNQQNSSAKSRAPPPAFDPERPMLVQPWREFEGRGWVEVIYLGGAITRTVKVKMLHREILTKEEIASGSDVYVGPQEAKDRIIKANLWKPMGKKGKGTGGEKLVELPKKSICAKDFDGSDQALMARARSVAIALGERTAAGRIGSMELSLPGKDTFATWWADASAESKVRLLSDKKHFDSLDAAKRQRLNTVLADCPFRGGEPVPAEKEEEGGESEELPIRPPPQKENAPIQKKKQGKRQAPSSE